MKVFVVLLFLATCSTASAQDNSAGNQRQHEAHDARMHSGNAGGQTILRESGQSAFATLIEITALLEADNDTDWSTVDLDGLRLHLLDMNHLILDTSASTDRIDDSIIQYTIDGSLEAIPAIHRMVPAHSRFIRQSRLWDIDTQLTDTGAILRIKTGSAAQLSRLSALGFYGFMSLDSHHQAHHLNIALGNSH